MESKIKAIIFDVDGVLFNSIDSDGKFLWSQNAKEDLGLTKMHFQSIFSKEWDLVTKGKLSTQNYFTKVFQTDLFKDLDINAETFIEYWLTRDRFINNDMISFVKEVEIPKYIATNQDFYRTNHIIELVGKNFKKVFASYEIGHLKPEPQFYKHIEDQLKLKGEEIIFIDDTQINVESAKNLGWNSFYYQNNFAEFTNYIKNLLA